MKFSKRFLFHPVFLSTAIMFLLIHFTNNLHAQTPDTLSSITGSDTSGKVLSEKESKKLYLPDTVYLKNGDKITGKILSFEQGRLSIDGQGPGVVSIKWYKIKNISGGNRAFKVEDIKGIIYIGKIRMSDVEGEIVIKNTLTYGITLANVVRIFPLETEWYRGLKGDLGAGVSYTKSSEVLQINADYNIYYVISKWRFINKFSFLSSAVGDETAKLRMQFVLQALYALPHKWVISELNSFTRNDELGIRSRISVAVGIGNNVVQTERQRLLLLTGLVQNSEKDIESNKYNSNFEWPATIQHTIYSFLRPNLSSNTSLTSYVGITEKGRYRFDASTDITWEFITNVKFKITIYYNYDNKILEGKTTKEDYGTILSLSVQLK